MTFGNERGRRLRDGLAPRGRHGRPRAWPRARAGSGATSIILGGRHGEAFSRRPVTSAPTTSSPGKRLWQFHTVPEPGEFGYETKPEGGYKYIGGANNWGEMSIDEERGIVYIPDRVGDLRFLRRRPPRQRTSSRTASARARRRAPASGSGTSRRSITTCGTSTTCRRRSS